MFSSGCCGRPRVLKRHSTRHRFEVLSRKKLIKRVLNLSEEPVRDKNPHQSIHIQSVQAIAECKARYCTVLANHCLY